MDPNQADCIFCARIRQPGEVRASNNLAVVVDDKFPLSPGHCLVVPRRHVADWFDLSGLEQAAIVRLTNRARSLVETSLSPDGYNIGINIGASGGQTVGHVHLHLIPRYTGDRPDPRGGVRWILPDTAPYWERRS